MLAVNTYTREYIDECQARMEAQLAAYEKLAAASYAQPALEGFEPLFFNNLILVLESYFVHRTRALEGKDGNPLNEVRMLCNSILRNKGVLLAEKTIKYQAEESVLKLRIGDEIRLGEAQFAKLSRAFFDEMLRRFA